MAFDGTEGALISKTNAGNLTAEWRKNNPDARLGAFLGKDIIKEILDQEGCMGIRVYYGQDGDKQMEPVFVGADADGSDMLDKIADNCVSCPVVCSASNDLNS